MHALKTHVPAHRLRRGAIPPSLSMDVTSRRTALKAMLSALTLSVMGVAGAGTHYARAQTKTSVATASTSAPAEVLLAVFLPADRLPQGPAAVAFRRKTWEPGFEDLASASRPRISIGGDVVLSGAWGARSDGPLIVWRDGQFQDVPAGTDAIVEPGEAVIYLDNAAKKWIRNAAATDTQVAHFAITLGSDYRGPNQGVDWEQSGLSGHDVTVTIACQTLALGEGLTIMPSDVAPTITIVEAGALIWTVLDADGEAVRAPVRFERGTVIPFTVPKAGSQIALRPVSIEPVVLLTMTVAAGFPTAAMARSAVR